MIAQRHRSHRCEADESSKSKSKPTIMCHDDRNRRVPRSTATTRSSRSKAPRRNLTAEVTVRGYEGKGAPVVIRTQMPQVRQ
jgi:hypothetical protein